MLLASFGWNEAGTWLGAIGTLAAVLYALYRDTLLGPRLTLSFDPDSDVRTQHTTIGIRDGVRSRWLRVRVENRSHNATAKNCRAYLIGVREMAPVSGRKPHVIENDVRQLAWMHDPPDTWQPRDLLPGIRHWVDLAATIEGTPAALMCTYPPMKGGASGDYTLTVQVSAENSSPTQICIRVRWDNDEFESLRGEVS